MRFRKKPVVIEAVQVVDSKDGIAAMCRFYPLASLRPDGSISIKTLEGWMVASIGDWVIKGVAGEFYPCKPDIFDQTYEPTEAPTT